MRRGMADGDGSAVRVDSFGVGLDGVLPGTDDRRVRFVELEARDAIWFQIESLQQPVGRNEGPLQHQVRVDAHGDRAADPSEWTQTEPFAGVIGGDHHCGGAVGELARRPCGDDTVVLIDWA